MTSWPCYLDILLISLESDIFLYFYDKTPIYSDDGSEGERIGKWSSWPTCLKILQREHSAIVRVQESVFGLITLVWLLW